MPISPKALHTDLKPLPFMLLQKESPPDPHGRSDNFRHLKPSNTAVRPAAKYVNFHKTYNQAVNPVSGDIATRPML